MCEKETKCNIYLYVNILNSQFDKEKEKKKNTNTIVKRQIDLLKKKITTKQNNMLKYTASIKD